MKHQKSSYSLHSTASTLLLKERSPNLYHRSPVSIYAKKAPSYSTSFANIHNARGKLNSCGLLMAELQKSS